MIKKQSIVALALLLLIPLVWMLGGILFSLINPEIAAGHPNYVQNYHRLSLLKNMCLVGIWRGCGCLVGAGVLSGDPLQEAIPAMAVSGGIGALRVRRPGDAERPGACGDRLYARFVRNLNVFVRVGYELCIFVIVWMLAYEGMVLKRTLMIRYEAATTGVSTAQIIDLQNASSGMWAFAEGNEVMYLVVLLYLLWPMVFNIVGRVAAPDGIAQGTLSLDFKAPAPKSR